MPKHNFMISKAVDLVARKLAGMDPETVARLTKILGEEAQMISEELQHSGQNVNADVLAARLDGLVTRMKYEVRNQGPDPSPYEFPIFNVSHNPISPYPNPINHLYDKRYKEAYSTFIKQNQPTPSTPQIKEPSTPTSPSSKPTTNPKSSSYPTYPQGQFQRQQSKEQPPPHPAGFLPAFRQQPTGSWQHTNPYATMSRSQAAYHQQQAAKLMPQVQEQPPINNTSHVRRSSTADDLRPQLSRSASSDTLNHSGAEKIRVRVINDPSSTDPRINPRHRIHSQGSVLNSTTEDDNNNNNLTTRTIYSAPNTQIGTETMEDLFKVVNNQRSEPSRSTATPMTERVIIIDRRGTNSSADNQNASLTDRFRTFEIRTPSAGATSSTPPLLPAATPTPATNTSSSGYTLQQQQQQQLLQQQLLQQQQQPNYYAGQQLLYQQPKMYGSVPNNMYSLTTPYGAGAYNFYPFTYYPY